MNQILNVVKNHWAEYFVMAIAFPISLIIIKRFLRFLRSLILNEDRMEYLHNLEEDSNQNYDSFIFYDANGECIEIQKMQGSAVKAFKPRKRTSLTFERCYDLQIDIINELKKRTVSTKLLQPKLSDYFIDDLKSKNRKCQITAYGYYNKVGKCFIKIEYYKNWLCRIIAFLLGYNIKSHQSEIEIDEDMNSYQKRE